MTHLHDADLPLHFFSPHFVSLCWIFDSKMPIKIVVFIFNKNYKVCQKKKNWDRIQQSKSTKWCDKKKEWKLMNRPISFEIRNNVIYFSRIIIESLIKRDGKMLAKKKRRKKISTVWKYGIDMNIVIWRHCYTMPYTPFFLVVITSIIYYTYA